MTIIREGDLEFSFGESWRVLKYDREGGYYRTRLSRQVENTKAMDLLCLRGNESLLMLEVKDFRRGVPEKEKRTKVPMIVAEKVRDTLAGVVGGSYTAEDPDRSEFTDSYAKLSSPPRVIFFFEDLATPERRLPQRALNKRSTLFAQLKGYLRWLTRDVAVVGLSDYRRFIRDLTVRSI